jgi:hypothetical protein
MAVIKWRISIFRWENIRSLIFPPFSPFEIMKYNMGYAQGSVPMIVHFHRMYSYSGFYNELHSKAIS